MGLIKFLKEKFSRKKREEIQEEIVSSKEEQVSHEQTVEEPALESKNKEEQTTEPILKEEASGELAVEESIAQESSAENPAKEIPVPVVNEKAEKDELVPEENVPSTDKVTIEEPVSTDAPITDTIAENEKETIPAAETFSENHVISDVEQVKSTSDEEKKKEEDVLDKYVAGLDKSRLGFTERIKRLARKNKVINREYFDELERILIEADVGVELSLELIKETSQEASAKQIEDPEELNDLLIDKMFIGYANEGGSFSTDIQMAKSGPTVVLMCGVNGSGKTTTVAKLAKKYKDRGLKVLLVAADTFRSGAVEQLVYWAERVGVDVVYKANSDPASLCYDALKKALNESYDIVFIDTAGRLQNKKELMDELRKVSKVIKKIIPDAPHEALLVIDANTGQNGIDQATVFKESVPLSGIVITKMDGTSKGGIILAIRKALSLPVRFIGLGEKMEDLEEFDLDKYLYGLLVGDSKED